MCLGSSGPQLPEGRPSLGKAKTLLKIELASSQNFGEKQDCQIAVSSPALPGHPARLPKAGFVFLGLAISLHYKPACPAPLSSDPARAASRRRLLILSLFAARHVC
jgi:hypothetical protein